jgi:hypothetical protein
VAIGILNDSLLQSTLRGLRTKNKTLIMIFKPLNLDTN